MMFSICLGGQAQVNHPKWWRRRYNLWWQSKCRYRYWRGYSKCFRWNDVASTGADNDVVDISGTNTLNSGFGDDNPCLGELTIK